MRIIIVCGNEDCRQEYKVDTNDRFWECPNCGRKRESDHYPFLSARLMQARIDKANGDWEGVHAEAIEKAEVKAQENDQRVRKLELALGRVGEDDGPPTQGADAVKAIRKADEAASEPDWRKRAETFIKDARSVLVAQEDRALDLEKELERKKKDRKARTKASR